MFYHLENEDKTVYIYIATATGHGNTFLYSLGSFLAMYWKPNIPEREKI